MPSALRWNLLALCLVSLVLQKTGNAIFNDFSDLSMAFDPDQVHLIQLYIFGHIRCSVQRMVHS